MTDRDPTRDPEQYVDEHADVLTRIVKHSSADFPRALALAALIEYGEDPAIETVIEELERVQHHRNSDR